MRPIIESGDHLEVLPNVQNYRVGDIVVLKVQGDLVVHRIIDIFRGTGQERFVTKGDMTLTRDEPIGRDEIYGKVVTITKANDGRKTDCTRLSALFSITAGLSSQSARLNDLVSSFCGEQSSALRRTGLKFMRAWVKASYVILRILTELYGLK
jgi:hypothetical protein